MSVGIWQTPDDQRPIQSVKTLIIGAGIIGSYLALRLNADLVLDARHVAGGASGRNGGLLLTGIANSYTAACKAYGRERTKALWSATIRNRELMIEWATRLGTPVRRCGSFIFGYSEAEQAELAQAVELMHEDGFEATWLEQDPFKRGFYGAIHNPNDGSIQPALLTAALLNASGARVETACEVYSAESHDNGVLVQSRNGAFLAQQVIIATNAWTGLLLPEFADLIVPARGQVLASAPTDMIFPHAAYCDYGFIYFQQTAEGRLVLGGFRNHAFEQEHTFADTTTPLIQTKLDLFLHRHFPELRDVPIERRWSGTMGFTRDHLPLIGTLPRDERIACAVGFSGHGLGMGMVVCEELISVLNGGTAELFALGRMLS